MESKGKISVPRVFPQHPHCRLGSLTSSVPTYPCEETRPNNWGTSAVYPDYLIDYLGYSFFSKWITESLNHRVVWAGKNF